MAGIYELPMLECSSCGTHLGHLYEIYYTLRDQLTDDLVINGTPNQTYTGANGDDLTPFITTYYEWLNTVDKDKVPDHQPSNIIARALLRTRELEKEHLPFGSAKEDDDQMSVHEARICCLRMFQTDPKKTNL